MMKKECLDMNTTTVTALMIGDFKMKFEPISARESQLDHYGKRGISWHGFCLQFYLLQQSVNKDGSIVREPRKYTVYLDQIISDCNKQDAYSVFSLLDMTMAQIANKLPFLTNIVLQTDNAKTYNNTFCCAQYHFLIWFIIRNLLALSNTYTPRPRMERPSWMPILRGV